MHEAESRASTNGEHDAPAAAPEAQLESADEEREAVPVEEEAPIASAVTITVMTPEPPPPAAPLSESTIDAAAEPARPPAPSAEQIAAMLQEVAGKVQALQQAWAEFQQAQSNAAQNAG
jgi:hypothetical protein